MKRRIVKLYAAYTRAQSDEEKNVVVGKLRDECKNSKCAFQYGPLLHGDVKKRFDKAISEERCIQALGAEVSVVTGTSPVENVNRHLKQKFGSIRSCGPDLFFVILRLFEAEWNFSRALKDPILKQQFCKGDSFMAHMSAIVRKQLTDNFWVQYTVLQE